MKRDGDIASLFQKHIEKKLAASAFPSPVPAAPVVEEEVQEPVQVQERIIEEDVNPSLVASSVLSESIEAEDVLPPIPPPMCCHHNHRFMMSIVFLMIQVKVSPLQVILLMIKM